MSKTIVNIGITIIASLLIYFALRSEIRQGFERLERRLEQRLAERTAPPPSETPRTTPPANGSLPAEVAVKDLEEACRRIEALVTVPLEQNRERDRAEKLTESLRKAGPAVVPLLAESFRKPGTLEYRRRLMRLIGAIDDERGFELASRAFLQEGENALVRWAAAAVMKELNPGKAAPVICEFVLENNGHAHQGLSYVIDTLQEIGGPEVEKTLLQVAIDANKESSMRHGAVRALGDLGVSEAEPYLRDMVEGETNGYLRIHAARALVFLDSKKNCEFLRGQESEERDSNFKTFLGQLLRDRCP